MITYLDFDWNEVYLYNENFEKIAQESNLVLKNLVDQKVLFIGNEAKENLGMKENILAIVPIENRKVNAFNEFDLIVKYLVKKYRLTNYLIVDRYGLAAKKISHLIPEKTFLKLQYQNGIYFDFRNNETIIYDVEHDELKVLMQGKYSLMRRLNEYFIKNFQATLNTKKLHLLLDNLATQKIHQVICRSYQTGQDLEAKINQKELLDNLANFHQKLQDQFSKNLLVHYSASYQKVFGFLWLESLE